MDSFGVVKFFKPRIDRLKRGVDQLYREGRIQEAIDLATKIRDLVGVIWGQSDPTYAGSLSRLARLYHAKGDYAAALPLCRRALEIRRTALGDDHPAYAVMLSNLARMYRAMGDYAAALPLLEQALGTTGAIFFYILSV
jgi:tetratricopeptide (TPR) repeat protein